MPQHEELIQVSNVEIIIAMSPLAIIGMISYRMGLDMESPLLVGVIRAYIQLSILGFILDPIFKWGVTIPWVVFGYAFLMVVLASYESSARSKYYLDGQFWMVLFPMMITITLVSLYAFCIVLKPTPRFDPQYVIPIIGMLLGNCINGVSLALNSTLTSLVESSREVELSLSFGAGPYEATSRLVRDAIRTGAMPLMNSMAVIGIISIPGMMTGQILGGTSVMQSARYQILIMYFICFSSFGMILLEIFLALQIMFDKRSILQIGLLTKRDKRPTFLAMVGGACQSLGRLLGTGRLTSPKRLSTSFTVRSDEATYLAPKGTLSVLVTSHGQSEGDDLVPLLEVESLSYGFEAKDDEEGGPLIDSRESGSTDTTFRLLFDNLTFKLMTGGIALITGPSGVGKSTLLRILAGLEDADAHQIFLKGRSQLSYSVMANYRKQVRYVPQTKVDIPGTPNDFIKKVSNFAVWKSDHNAYEEMRSTTRDLIKDWGMSASLLDAEWKTLSGGESQRCLVAISVASTPMDGIILLDESTSSLDRETTLKVEESVKEYCRKRSIAAIWISHDPSQRERMLLNGSP